MFSESPLCSPPQCIFDHLACRLAHLCVPKLLARDQPAANAGHQVDGDKGKDADLEGLWRSGILRKGGRSREGQQQNQARNHNHRDIPVGFDFRAIQPGFRVNR